MSSLSHTTAPCLLDSQLYFLLSLKKAKAFCSYSSVGRRRWEDKKCEIKEAEAGAGQVHGVSPRSVETLAPYPVCDSPHPSSQLEIVHSLTVITHTLSARIHHISQVPCLCVKFENSSWVWCQKSVILSPGKWRIRS